MKRTAINIKNLGYRLHMNLTSWGGGEMPIEAGTPVIVLHRDGELFVGKVGESVAADWRHDSSTGDILAWAEVKVPQRSKDAFRLL